MQVKRVKFYKIEISKNDQETRHFLGYKDVIVSTLSDGTSFLAKAFRAASVEQRDANSVEVTDL